MEARQTTLMIIAQSSGLQAVTQKCMLLLTGRRGGGNRVNKTMDLRSPPLRWMVLEAKYYGL
jgi:hypothetical protein